MYGRGEKGRGEYDMMVNEGRETCRTGSERKGRKDSSREDTESIRGRGSSDIGGSKVS